MVNFILFMIAWPLLGLGGLALFNYFVALEEKEERNLFFNDDVDCHEVFFLLGPLSIILVLVVAACFKAKEYLSNFKVGA